MKREDEVEVRTEEGRTEDDGGTRNPSDLETGLILQSTEHYEQARLFYTASEYIGYGPHSIQKGDLICVLPQIRVPIIPRQAGRYKLYRQHLLRAWAHGPRISGDVEARAGCSAKISYLLTW
jgi:hypothetical protein